MISKKKQFTGQIITLNNDWGENLSDGKLISRARRNERERGNKISLLRDAGGAGELGLTPCRGSKSWHEAILKNTYAERSYRITKVLQFTCSTEIAVGTRFDCLYLVPIG